MYSQDQELEFFELSKKLLEQELAVSDYDNLADLLKYHEWKYYVKNDNIISDYEYDLLYKKLEALEENNQIKIRPDSPTQRVSNDLSKNFSTVEHYSPMLSLSNSYNQEDLDDFDTQVKKLSKIESGDIAYYVEPKLDGGSIALVYENDLLVRAATRGNGSEGEDITLNAKSLPSIPLRVKFSEHGIYRAELRGEAVIHKETFAKKNQEREKEGLTLFANPRNAASGGLRMKNPNDSRDRGLEVFIFNMAYAIDQNQNDILTQFETHAKVINILGNNGFKIPNKGIQTARNIKQAFDIARQWEEGREEYPYEIDGAVIKVDSLLLQSKCGATQHHPRWAIAFKFKAKQATSTLLEIEYQVGKTGAITPVAKVEPVHLAGVTVSSISLHNEDFIVQKDLRVGDKVVIERAGDVIPYIVKSLQELRTGKEEPIRFPTTCPSCNAILEKKETQAAWRCYNPKCPAQNLERIIYHISKEAMNIDGFGKSYVEKFMQLDWVKDISDVYNLDYEKIADLEGFGKKSVENLKAAIDKAKKNPLHRLLNSLSINQLGSKASKLIAQEIESIYDIIDWDVEKYTEIKDVGPILAENVISWFSEEENVELIRRLEAYGVNVKQTEQDKPKIIKQDAPFVGKTILFTGSLEKMSRKEAQKLAEENGAKNISAVSSNLNILVVGEKAGSKLKKAQSLGTVEILSEEEFLLIINK